MSKNGKAVNYRSLFTGSVSERCLAKLADRPLPRIGPVARILLLCAREEITKDQRLLLETLCTEIMDWDELLKQARFRLIIPMVHLHLSCLAQGVVPPAVLARLKNDARRAMLTNLAMITVHHRLVRDVFKPLKVPFLFFKGPSLAFRYYREPAMRQFRDIDVLIPRREMFRVGRRMRDYGFRSYPHARLASDEGLWFQQKFVGMMDWVSPEGILVEMPSSLDSNWERLPTDQVIDRSESIAIGDLVVPVASNEDFFCYMCRHHSRHHWARLHWVADLNAIVGWHGPHLSQIRIQAAKLGFSRTVDGALAIQNAAGMLEPWLAKFDDLFARELFRHCLMNLEGDFQQELELRETFPATDIDISAFRLYKRHFISRNVRRFLPNGDDFTQLSLPIRLHWLYYFIRPFLWLSRKIMTNRDRDTIKPAGA